MFTRQQTSSPLSDPILDRFCSEILPEIGHRIKTLYLERTSMERILHATNYPNLNNLSLCHIDSEVAKSLFDGKNSLTHIFNNQISSLFINFNDVKDSLPMRTIYSIIFAKILTIFTNLRCLKFNPSSSYRDAVLFYLIRDTAISSTLLELHVGVVEMRDCLDILDGRFDQLRILHVTVYGIYPWFFDIEHGQNLLPNLRIFSLCCKKITDFDKSIVSVVRRMLNLEELHLNIIVECNGRLIDGDTLMKDIILYMPRLYKFTFNICSTIKHCDQTNFALNQHIEKTLEYFHNNEIITCIDHFQENGCSQCHIYSYPYKWKVYNNITNNFRGGLFTSVTEVSLYDERPFEDEFFLRIAQSFPFMKELTIKNLKAQNKKQLVKSNNDNQMLSIIEYPNLTRLDLAYTHHDYVELFLFDRKMALPNHLHLRVDYQSLEKVTYNFARYTRPNNCAKLAALYFYLVDQIDEHIKKYFPHTSMRCTDDFVLRK
ncbi:unnamed protein product [Rotaria magnacalcarata]|uniref:Uncharacterized protein n=4 Tax=Rotaria magnacalcarata TaxID=392030 RepID=A0A816VK60_9BILA|nr:unnamed protein product [Rotaria magnacalcarata]